MKPVKLSKKVDTKDLLEISNYVQQKAYLNIDPDDGVKRINIRITCGKTDVGIRLDGPLGNKILDSLREIKDLLTEDVLEILDD